MGEEIKRIEEVKRAQQASAQSRSTNLTGEQLFIRSCNTCHPSGRKGMGPSLENLDTDFKDETALKKFIRTGKGMMPGQPKSEMNEDELNNLIGYLHQVVLDLKEK